MNTKKRKNWFKYIRNKNFNLKIKMLAACLLTTTQVAQASTSTGMPWEDPLEKVMDSITGPVAYGVSIGAVVVSALGIIFGAELDGFIKKLLMIALAISLIVFAAQVISSVFGVSSMLI